MTDHAELGGGNRDGRGAKKAAPIAVDFFVHLSLSNWQIGCPINTGMPHL
jgi:hypothetical protein